MDKKKQYVPYAKDVGSGPKNSDSARHNPVKPRKREMIAQRRTLVWDLMRNGVTDVRSIAKALESQGIRVSKATVHSDIMCTLGEFKERRLNSVQSVVESEVAQLDSMEQQLAPALRRGDTKAVLAAVRIKERRARLLGLDAPDQWAHEAELRRMVSREQVLAYMRALSGIVVEAIEAHIADQETRTSLRSAIAQRFALASGGRSGEDDLASGGYPLVIEAQAGDSSSSD